MQIKVLFFGYLKETTGDGSAEVELAEGSRIADLLAECARRRPLLEPYYEVMAVALNESYAERTAALRDGDVVALIPPVSGGSQNVAQEAAQDYRQGNVRASIVLLPIVTQAIVKQLQRGEDGALAVFEGVVRNNTRGRRTLYLDYSAYESMALKQMEELVRQALAQFKIRDAALVHRLGKMEIGEISVLIVVASAHRGPALDACRWLIDTLKKTVPIWKKEYFEDGVVWADGEPFPAEIARASGTGDIDSASK